MIFSPSDYIRFGHFGGFGHFGQFLFYFFVAFFASWGHFWGVRAKELFDRTTPKWGKKGAKWGKKVAQKTVIIGWTKNHPKLILTNKILILNL